MEGIDSVGVGYDVVGPEVEGTLKFKNNKK